MNLYEVERGNERLKELLQLRSNLSQKVFYYAHKAKRNEKTFNKLQIYETQLNIIRNEIKEVRHKILLNVVSNYRKRYLKNKK